jgi:hypothetical protein
MWGLEFALEAAALRKVTVQVERSLWSDGKPSLTACAGSGHWSVQDDGLHSVEAV